MKIRFYPKDKTRPSTVVASVHYKGKRYFVYTRETVNPKYWLGSRVSAKHPDHEYVNGQIQKWEDTIKDAMKDLTSDLSVPTQAQLRDRIKRKIEGPVEANEYLTVWAEDYLTRANKTYGTIAKYKTLVNLLKQYESQHEPLRFKDIDQRFIKKFREFLDHYSINYIGSQFKNLKVFLRVSNEELGHGVTLNIKVEKEESSQVYLSLEELDSLRNLDLSWEGIVDYYPGLDNARISQKIASLNAVRDRFLIGAFTGLRISDYKRLSDINIDGDYIRIEPRKGGRNQEVIIPIHPVVKDILDRGLPRPVSEQKLNVHIKELCRMAGITQKVETSITKGGRVVRDVKMKYELVTTHTARRSFATNAYKSGVSSLAIMALTGHSSEKSFLKYIKISREENAEILRVHSFFGGASRNTP